MKTELVESKEENYQEGVHYVNGCKHSWNNSDTLVEGKCTTFDEIEITLSCVKCGCWYEVKGIVSPLHWHSEEDE